MLIKPKLLNLFQKYIFFSIHLHAINIDRMTLIHKFQGLKIELIKLINAMINQLNNN
jgi:hypothetical protein